jgi:hypothetical protein
MFVLIAIILHYYVTHAPIAFKFNLYHKINNRENKIQKECLHNNNKYHKSQLAVNPISHVQIPATNSLSHTY